MKLKLFIIAILLMFVSLTNTVRAEIWYPVTGVNGNTQEIELDTIKIDGDFANYNCKKTDENYTYISKMKINLSNKTFALLSIKALQDDKQISFKDNSKNIQYVAIKDGSLADAVYNMLIVAKQSPALDVNLKIWEKYFKKQQKIIQKNWHPNLYSYIGTPKERAIAYVTLVVDKNGNILSKTYQNNTNKGSDYDEFNKGLKEKIEKIFVKVSKFEPLPKEFKGENIILVLKFEYSYNHDAKVQKITWKETGIGYLENGKNHSYLIDIGKGIGFVVAIPFVIAWELLKYLAG